MDKKLIRRIVEGINIVDKVKKYVDIISKNNNYWGNCPFHKEKTASFSVSESKQMYYCFGCHAGGDVIDFLMRIQNKTFSEVIVELAEEQGIELDNREIKNRLGILYKITQEQVEAYHSNIELAQDFLKRRNINNEMKELFYLGYSPDKNDTMYGRLIFPIFDTRFRPIGYGGRIIEGGGAKYLNSPNSEIFKKSKILYGWNVAREWIGETGEVFLVEGYFDVISMCQKGFRNAVGLLGTNLSQEQIEVLRSCRPVVHLMLDNDDAGASSTIKNSIQLFNSGLLMDVVEYSGKDPDASPDRHFNFLLFAEWLYKYFNRRISDKYKIIVQAEGILSSIQGSIGRLVRNEFEQLLGIEEKRARDEIITSSDIQSEDIGIRASYERRLMAAALQNKDFLLELKRDFIPQNDLYRRLLDGEGDKEYLFNSEDRNELAWLLNFPIDIQKIKREYNIWRSYALEEF